MASVVECVPNFSEGRDKQVIEAISEAIRQTDGCTLLDVDNGESTNRTVYTFVGTPSAVVQGALNAAKIAYHRIVMTTQKGEHPRIGALDVCPFIPVRGVSMADCIKCSNEFGQLLAEMFNVPVYLYEESSCRDYRKSLPQIRSGEYEGLQHKLSEPKWVPDYGPASFVPSWGATVTGARKFLIAYNVNLLATKQQAHRIALNIREQGRGPNEPGTLKCVKAIGWYLNEKDIAQVSINLTDYETTPIHIAYEECVKNSVLLNLPVTGSQIVGLVPLEAMLMAADYYIKKENLFIINERQKIFLAIDRLGLNSLSLFEPDKRIIEYCLVKKEPLLSLSLRGFVEAIGARTSAPGGGSASACIASIGAALSTMVGLMTYGKRQYDTIDGIMRRSIAPLYEAMQTLLTLVDKDTNAFNSYMIALKLPKRTNEEKEKRDKEMEAGLKEAIVVPLNIMTVCQECWPHLAVLAEHGNIQTMSDLQEQWRNLSNKDTSIIRTLSGVPKVALVCNLSEDISSNQDCPHIRVAVSSLETGLFGGYCNVMINLKNVNDDSYVANTTREVKDLLENGRLQARVMLEVITKRIEL